MEVFADEKSATVITTVSPNPRDEDGHTDRHFCLLEAGWSWKWWKPTDIGGKELDDDKDFVALLQPFELQRDGVDQGKSGVVCQAGTFIIGIHDTSYWRLAASATSVRVTPILVRSGVASKAEEVSQTIELKGLTRVPTPIGVRSIVFVTNKARKDSVTVLVRVEVNTAFGKGPREPTSDVVGEDATPNIVIIKLIPFEVQDGTFFGEHPPKAVRKRNPQGAEEDDEDLREMSVDLPAEFEIKKLDPGKKYHVTAAVKLANFNQWSAENEATGDGHTLPMMSDEPVGAGFLGRVTENVQKQVGQIATFCKDDQNQNKIVDALPAIEETAAALAVFFPSAAEPVAVGAKKLQKIADVHRKQAETGAGWTAGAVLEVTAHICTETAPQLPAYTPGLDSATAHICAGTGLLHCPHLRPQFLLWCRKRQRRRT